MKKILRGLFSPILNIFESTSEAFVYKPSHRVILVFIGFVFTVLASLVLWFAWGQDPAYLLPVVIFGGIGLVCLVVGGLGTDQGVAKIWNSR